AAGSNASSGVHTGTSPAIARSGSTYCAAGSGAVITRIAIALIVRGGASLRSPRARGARAACSLGQQTQPLDQRAVRRVGRLRPREVFVTGSVPGVLVQLVEHLLMFGLVHRLLEAVVQRLHHRGLHA